MGLQLDPLTPGTPVPRRARLITSAFLAAHRLTAFPAVRRLTVSPAARHRRGTQGRRTTGPCRRRRTTLRRRPFPRQAINSD